MTIMIDECTARGARLSSDADDDGAELHKFARTLGVKRSWFRDEETFPHYFLTPFNRGKAHAAGAKFVPASTQEKARDAKRAKVEVTHGQPLKGTGDADGLEPSASSTSRIGDE